MSVNIKVATTGIIALCLTLSALLFMFGVTRQSIQDAADKFFGLAVILIVLVVALSFAGIKIRKFP